MKTCKCGCDTFITKLEVVAQIKIDDDSKIGVMGIDDNNTVVIEKISCASCGTEYEKEELLSKVCKKCNQSFSSDLINSNGLCSACQTIIDRFSNLTQDDLIAMVLKLEQEKLDSKPKTKRSTSKAKKKEEVDKVEQPATVEKAPVVSENNALGNTNLLEGVDMTGSLNEEDEQDTAKNLMPKPTATEIPIVNNPMDMNGFFPQNNGDGFGAIDINNIGLGFPL